jgi:hypothetical protein
MNNLAPKYCPFPLAGPRGHPANFLQFPAGKGYTLSVERVEWAKAHFFVKPESVGFVSSPTRPLMGVCV